MLSLRLLHVEVTAKLAIANGSCLRNCFSMRTEQEVKGGKSTGVRACSEAEKPSAHTD